MPPASWPSAQSRLLKHSSLPELHIRDPQEAGDEFKRSVPRARRASSPPEACQSELPHDPIPSLTTTAVAHGKNPERGCLEDPPSPSFVAHSMIQAPATTRAHDSKSHDDNLTGETSELLEGDITGQLRSLDENDVATATHSPSCRQDSLCVGQEGLHDPLLLSESDPLPSEEPDLSLGVDRSEPEVVMPLPDKPSRKLIFVDAHDTDTKGDEFTMNNQDDTSSLCQHRLRTSRRRKHLNVLQTSSNVVAPEAIAISLTVRSSTSKPNLKPIDTVNSRALSQQISITTDTTDSPVTPNITPEYLSMPPSTAPNGLSASPVSSSPVRLGHPSRPYYSAIRKNGISPTSSHPISVVGSPSAPLHPRRQSYTPSTSTPPAMSTAASRRLSMSTMFYSPAYSLPAENAFSAFSLVDDEDLDDASDADMPVLPPTPAPGAARFSFSLPRRTKETRRFSHSEHSHSHTLSYAKGPGRGYRGSGVGFSMSGQTELRMALAEGAASAGIAEDGFRFSATKAAAPSALGEREDGVNSPGSVTSGAGRVTEGMDAASGNNFMERVRKLRKGLKDMLLTTSTTI